MKRTVCLLWLVCLSVVLINLPGGRGMAGENWAAFRGDGTDADSLKKVPLRWSETETMAWEADLAGFGQSSPVIWEDRVYVTSTGGDHKEKLFVQSFGLTDGAEIWTKELAATQTAPEVTDMISRGAPTPVADGDGLYAFFESGDLVALDREGEVRWQRSLTAEYGDFVGGHGIGTSLVSTPKGIVVLIDHDGPSYLLCVDRKTGENLWKTDREKRVSWTTPIYRDLGGVPQVIVSSNGELCAYGLDDGKKIWWVENLEGNTVASPVTNGKVVVIGASAPENCLAVDPSQAGETGEAPIIWRASGVTSSFGSPLIRGDSVFFVNRAGALQAVSLTDGSLQWERRLPASTWASPLSLAEHLYFFCNNGQTVVFGEGLDADAEPIATNSIPVAEGDRLYGYAVAEGRIVMRTSTRLFAAGE